VSLSSSSSSSHHPHLHPLILPHASLSLSLFRLCTTFSTTQLHSFLGFQFIQFRPTPCSSRVSIFEIAAPRSTRAQRSTRHANPHETTNPQSIRASISRIAKPDLRGSGASNVRTHSVVCGGLVVHTINLVGIPTPAPSHLVPKQRRTEHKKRPQPLPVPKTQKTGAKLHQSWIIVQTQPASAHTSKGDAFFFPVLLLLFFSPFASRVPLVRHAQVSFPTRPNLVADHKRANTTRLTKVLASIHRLSALATAPSLGTPQKKPMRRQLLGSYRLLISHSS